MCIMKSYETRGRDVLDPPPRRGNYTSHPPAGVMRLPREWRRSDEYVVADSSRRARSRSRVVEYRNSEPRAIGYYEDGPRRSTQRVRSVSRRRAGDVEVREPRRSYVEEREPRRSYVEERDVRRSVSRVRY